MPTLTFTVSQLTTAAAMAANLASSYKGKNEALSRVRLLITSTPVGSGRVGFFSASNGAQSHTMRFVLNDLETEETEVLLDGAKLRQILSAYKSFDAQTPVTFEWNGFGGGKGLFKAAKSKLKIDTDDPTTYPSPLKLQGDNIAVATLSYGVLSGAIKSARHAVARNDVRAQLNGLNIFINENGLTLNSSDGHRLFRTHIDDISIENSINATIPAAVIDMILAIGAPADAPVRVRLDKAAVEVACETTLLRSPLIDAQYPDIAPFFADESNLTWLAEIESGDMIGALQRLQAGITNARLPAVTMAFDSNGNELPLKTVVQGNITGEDSVTTKVIQASSEALSFNLNYLIDAFGSLKSKITKVAFNAERGFLLAKDESGKSQSIIMSIKVQ